MKNVKMEITVEQLALLEMLVADKLKSLPDTLNTLAEYNMFKQLCYLQDTLELSRKKD